MRSSAIFDEWSHRDVLRKIKAWWVDKLHFVVDFDRTLTKSFINQEERTSLISILRHEGYLWEEYSKRAYELFHFYHPIETDPDIDITTKKEKMVKWWNAHMQLLVDSSLCKKHIYQAINSGIIQLREGYEDFFEYLKTNNIPLVIISANGLGGDSIRLFLEDLWLMHDNIFIVSNRFKWEGDKAVGYKKPVIHTFNKDETVLKNFPETYKTVKDRRNVILMGDSLGDHHMIDGFKYENLIKIGFLNKDIEEKMQAYQERYDVVLTNDASLDFVNSILKEIK